jgi:hypothetical protein
MFFLLRQKWVTNNSLRDWDRSLQLFSVNEEFLVSTKSSTCADYVPALCTHRPSLLPIECFSEIFSLVFRSTFGSFGLYRKDVQTGSFRGSKSRNKVFVGEPAYRSLTLRVKTNIYRTIIIIIIVSYQKCTIEDSLDMCRDLYFVEK